MRRNWATYSKKRTVKRYRDPKLKPRVVPKLTQKARSCTREEYTSAIGGKGSEKKTLSSRRMVSRRRKITTKSASFACENSLFTSTSRRISLSGCRRDPSQSC